MIGWVIFALYLTLTFSGVWAVVEFFRQPDYDKNEGVDVSLGELLMFTFLAAIPFAGTVSTNLFWLRFVWRKIHKDGPIVVFHARTRKVQKMEI